MTTEMIGLIVMGISGIAGGATAWQKLIGRIDLIDNQDTGLIKTSRSQLDTKIDAVKTELIRSIDDHAEKDGSIFTGIARQLDGIWTYKKEHEKETTDVRLAFNNEIGKINATLAVHTTQYDTVNRLLTQMDAKIDRLGSLIESLRKN